MSDSVIHPQQVTSLEDVTEKLYLDQHQAATWEEAFIDLEAGRSVVGFDAVAGHPEDYPFVSVDDIQLLETECANLGRISIQFSYNT